MCYNACGIKVHRVNGVILKIEGDPENPSTLGRLCAKGNAGIMSLYRTNRVKTPLKRTNPEKGIGVDPKWAEIGWDEALDTITEKLKKIKEDPRKLVLFTFDNPCIKPSLFWTIAFGTPNFNNMGANYYCGNCLHPVAHLTHGTFFWEPDLEYCNYLILWGTNNGFGQNHLPTLAAQKMADARMRGMKVIAIDPVCAQAASKSDEWIPIRPGTDSALALSMINVLLNDLGIYDVEFIKKHSNGPYLVGPDGHYVRDKTSNKPLIFDAVDKKGRTFDALNTKDFTIEGECSINDLGCKPAFQILKNHIKRYTPEIVSEITTVPANTIRRIAKEFGETARIGSTIVIDGVALPYRPVCVDYYRGISQHKHSLLNGLAVNLLNIVVGAIDVPGGHLGTSPIGPYEGWNPRESSDGMLMRPTFVQATATMDTYPARKVVKPARLDLFELFPIACYSDTLVAESLLHPELYKLPYEPEMMVIARCNWLMSCANPNQMAEAFKRIPFILEIAFELNEGAEFADIVLPDTHYFERLDPFPAMPYEWVAAGRGFWYWLFRQPVVKPPPGVKPWLEVLYELGYRLNLQADLYPILNIRLALKDPYKLDPKKKYSWEEISDRWLKSMFGPEHDLVWFKKNGFYISGKRKIEEAYPRHFLKPKVPLYYEHFINAGRDVKKVTDEMGLKYWDISDYQPLPDWKPCPAYKEKALGRDLFAVNYKLPFHTFTHTGSNPWLMDVSGVHSYAFNIMINTETAKKKNIKDGDTVWVESEIAKLKGKAKVSECVHPEVVGIAGCFGHWASGLPVGKGKGVHFNSLIPQKLENTDMFGGALDACVKVKVYKA